MKTVKEMQKFAKGEIAARKETEKQAHDMCVEILKEMGVTETNKLSFRDADGYVIDEALCFTSCRNCRTGCEYCQFECYMAR